MFSTTDKSQKLVADIGDIPDGFTLLVPGQFSEWKKTKWVDDTDAAAAAAKETNNAQVKAALQDVDVQSIRALREWIVSQPNAPSFTKDQEKAAQELRKKLLK